MRTHSGLEDGNKEGGRGNAVGSSKKKEVRKGLPGGTKGYL